MSLRQHRHGLNREQSYFITGQEESNWSVKDVEVDCGEVEEEDDDGALKEEQIMVG